MLNLSAALIAFLSFVAVVLFICGMTYRNTIGWKRSWSVNSGKNHPARTRVRNKSDAQKPSWQLL